MKEPKIGKLVKVKRNPFYDVLIRFFEVQMKLNLGWMTISFWLRRRRRERGADGSNFSHPIIWNRRWHWTSTGTGLGSSI